jgi:hypothetical protein
MKKENQRQAEHLGKCEKKGVHQRKTPHNQAGEVLSSPQTRNRNNPT